MIRLLSRRADGRRRRHLRRLFLLMPRLLRFAYTLRRQRFLRLSFAGFLTFSMLLFSPLLMPLRRDAARCLSPAPRRYFHAIRRAIADSPIFSLRCYAALLMPLAAIAAFHCGYAFFVYYHAAAALC